VADDEIGRFFRHDMQSAGIAFPTDELTDGTPTARSLILITPDSERTMNTYLGASQELTPDDIDPDIISAAAITYLEGYLWDPPKAKEAFRVASDIAHGAGRQVAITLSDTFCVDRYRDEFLGLMKAGAVDIVFANHHEALALYQTSDVGTALRLLAEEVPLAVVTMGGEGSLVMNGADQVRLPAPPVDEVVDKTGAGDLFAAGFLYGFARGAPLKRCAELGSLAAGEVISHVGARPVHRLADLAAEQGLTA
jgi:sugar/nucleoside kinase (ribokinase family)